MDLDLGSALGIGADLLGTAWSAKQNRNAQARNLDFQKWAMSNRYQALVKDLEAAGLNPMVAIGKASPGSPSGASMSGAQGTNVSGAYQAARVAQEQVKLLQDQQATQKSIGNMNDSQTQLNIANTATAKETKKLISAQAQGQEFSNVGSGIEADIQENFGEIMRGLEHGSNSAQKARQLLYILKSFMPKQR